MKVVYVIENRYFSSSVGEWKRRCDLEFSTVEEARREVIEQNGPFQYRIIKRTTTVIEEVV